MVRDLRFDQPDCRAIVLGREGWHPGVIGIVASRLAERFHRPVVMLNYDNGQAHGSARSIDGICMHTALTACATHLSSYGGHAMAAGLRLPTDAVEAFRQALVEHVNARLAPEAMVGTIHVDAECGLEDLTVTLCEQMQRLAPFGRDNPRPMLCVTNARLARPAARIGQGGDHLRLLLAAERHMLQAVGFHLGHLADDLPAGLELDLVFEPRLSHYRGYPRVDIHVKDLLPRSRAATHPARAFG
jgi:single-stranded-DNA-specific exonuclease